MDISKENLKREEFRNILFDLAKGQEVLQAPSDRINMYMRLEALYYPQKGEKCFRHFYSDIFMVLTQIEGDASRGDINILGENLRFIRKGYMPRNVDDEGNLIDIEDSIKKLYDHVNLDIARISYLAAGQKENIGELAINDIQAQVSRLSVEADRVSAKQEDVEKELQNQQKEYIAILGIFASIVLTFNAGIAFSSSVLESINSASVYRVVLIALIIGIVLVNVLFALFYYIDRLVLKDHHLKVLDRVNIILLALVVLTVAAWSWGVVERRNDRINNSFATESITEQETIEIKPKDEAMDTTEIQPVEETINITE